MFAAGCDKNEDIIIPDEPDMPEQPDDPVNPEPEDKAVDLSADEMANCYIVTEPGLYKFKADNQFNLGEGLPVPESISPVSAALLWQTERGSVATVDLIGDKDPYVEFEITQAKGNALIAACDDNGNVVWSWHIWMPDEEPFGVKSAMGYEIMNMNLGALNNTPGDVNAYGMLYQWGRKDPFPASPTLVGDTSTVGAPLYDIDNNPVAITNSSWYNDDVNTIEYAVANPTVCLSNYSHYGHSRDWLRESDDTLWGNPDGEFRDKENNIFPNKGRKTCYDPSPAGWKVAPADAFRNLTTSGGYASDPADVFAADVNGDGKVDINDYVYGWSFLVDKNTPLYFPAAARYDGSYAMLMGSVSGYWGSYWSNSPYAGISGGAYCCLSFSVKDQSGKDTFTVSPAGGSSRADAFSIRCVRDS